jgi:hypothetical protein
MRVRGVSYGLFAGATTRPRGCRRFLRARRDTGASTFNRAVANGVSPNAIDRRSLTPTSRYENSTHRIRDHDPSLRYAARGPRLHYEDRAVPNVQIVQPFHSVQNVAHRNRSRFKRSIVQRQTGTSTFREFPKPRNDKSLKSAGSVNL